MTDEIRSVSSTGAEKGVKAAALNLVPTGPLMKLAEHYNAGAKKYAEHNWRGGYEWSKSYAALMRHALQFWDGQDNDEETGTPHMAAVAFHAFALLEYAETHPEFDDRYKPEASESDYTVEIGGVVAADPAEALRQLQRYQAFGPGSENSSDRDHLLDLPKRGELFTVTGIPFYTEDGEVYASDAIRRGDTVRIIEGVDNEGDVLVRVEGKPGVTGNVSTTVLDPASRDGASDLKVGDVVRVRSMIHHNAIGRITKPGDFGFFQVEIPNVGGVWFRPDELVRGN